MYRNIFCFAVALMLLLVSSALAAPRDMTLEDASIAGISPGNDLMYVRSIYGEPDGEKTRKIGNYPSYLVDYYGQGFVITYDIIGGKTNPLVQTIESTNSALVMPSGVRVGMKIADVLKIFKNLEVRPAADKKYAKDYMPPFGALPFSLPSGEEGIRFVVFMTDQNGVIQKILIKDKYGDV
ncbi:hypothetical protein [uncultured Selenomonas sp.]|uniref:hypothetical protein n=1 Tax=uncultured Selenomonas sp. TaxID=159275 RepID=UPI0028E2A81F|nr:hypothetical protein [uncultured Selenomonas sp.]